MADRHKNRIAHNRIDLIGRRFGKLVVTKDSGLRKSRRPIWDCECDCGNKAKVIGKYLLCGDTKSCGCLKNTIVHNKDVVGAITKSYWTPLVKQAEVRGIPITVTREEVWELYLSQCGRCALTGLPITFASNVRDQRGKQTASLDRIHSNVGYHTGNVQWVHKRINIMKNTMSNGELLGWCRTICGWADENSIWVNL